MMLKDRFRQRKGNGWLNRDRRYTRSASIERLEDRQMLSAGNLFAEFIGIADHSKTTWKSC